MDILLNENPCPCQKRRIYLLEEDTEYRREERRESLGKWQQQWNDSQGGHYTQKSDSPY